MFVLTLIGLLLIFSFKTAQAADPSERVVTIHDKSLETTIVTRATTVAAALKQAKLQTSSYDSVDPSLDTKLTDTGYQINIYRAQPVMVIDGVIKKSVMTSYETPKEIAKDAGLPLFDEDKTTLTRSTNIIDSDGSGLTLTIDRATKFTLILYGKTIEARTQATTVAGMIREKSIKLAASDTVSVPLNTKIIPDLRVEIWRNGVQTVNEDQPIDFPVQQIQDASQPIGYKAIKTPGVLGKKNVTFEINMQNGKEVARREIQSVQTLAPQTQVEIVGTKLVGNVSAQKAYYMGLAGISQNDFTYVDYIIGRESGWNADSRGMGGACGLPQASPCSKLGANWNDPVNALQWANDYAVSRYGSWGAAYNHWQVSHNW